MDMIVDDSSQQVVSRADSMKVTGEVQVDISHGYNLGIATTGSTTLHPEARAEAGFPQTDYCLLPQFTERIT